MGGASSTSAEYQAYKQILSKYDSQQLSVLDNPDTPQAIKLMYTIKSDFKLLSSGMPTELVVSPLLIRPEAAVPSSNAELYAAEAIESYMSGNALTSALAGFNSAHRHHFKDYQPGSAKANRVQMHTFQDMLSIVEPLLESRVCGMGLNNNEFVALMKQRHDQHLETQHDGGDEDTALIEVLDACVRFLDFDWYATRQRMLSEYESEQAPPTEGAGSTDSDAPSRPAVYRLGERLRLDEDSTHEFKAGRDEKLRRTNMAKYLCAFLNSGGGTIYFGVSDDGVVTGVPMNSRQRDETRLCKAKRINAIRAHCQHALPLFHCTVFLSFTAPCSLSLHHALSDVL
jgi:hypothetical protein